MVGTPPPLVRASDHLFTAAEVEGLLAVREKEVLTRQPRALPSSSDYRPLVLLTLNVGGPFKRRVYLSMSGLIADRCGAELTVDASASLSVSYTHLTLPTIYSV